MTACGALPWKPRLSDDLCSNNFHRRIRRLIHLTSLHGFPVIKDLPVAAESEAGEGFISEERGARTSLWSPSLTVDGKLTVVFSSEGQFPDYLGNNNQEGDVEMSSCQPKALVSKSSLALQLIHETKIPKGGESRCDAAVLVTAKGYATLCSVIQGGV